MSNFYYHAVRLLPIYIVAQIIFIVARNPALEEDSAAWLGSLGSALMAVGLYMCWVIVSSAAQVKRLGAGSLVGFILLAIIGPTMTITSAYILRALVWGVV